jgi:phosphatidate phosphatase PAH1
MSFATDIITVEHKDGSIKGTPFCVRFKTQKLRRVVTVFVNGKQIIANECGWGLVVEAGGCFAKFAKIDPLTLEPEKKKKYVQLYVLTLAGHC